MSETSNTMYITETNDRDRNLRRGWYSIHQLSSMTTGALIFISGGMNMAQGLGWSQVSLTGSMNHFHYSWFIAVIVGTILTLLLKNIIPKKFLMAVSALLILAGGAIFTSSPNSVEALVAARYLNGIAVGLAIVPFLMHASEISRSSSRGACLAIEQYALTYGIAMQMIYISQWSENSEFPSTRLHGILDIILAVLAAASLIYYIESPLDYIRMGNDAAALETLDRLQRSPILALETNIVLEEYKEYLREQENMPMGECIVDSIFTMFKMIFFRSMMLAFSFSLPLSLALQHSVSVNHSRWSPITAACLRIIGGFLALSTVDKVGRKLTSLICACLIGSIMVAIAVIFNRSSNYIDPPIMSTINTLCLMIQCFAGFYTPFTSAYIGESFPLKLKPYFIGLCVIIEQLIQIIVTSTSKSIGNDGVFMAQGIMILITFVCLCVTMPETKRTSLKQAQELFSGFFNFKMY